MRNGLMLDSKVHVYGTDEEPRPSWCAFQQSRAYGAGYEPIDNQVR